MGYPAAMGGCAVVCGDVMSGDAGTICPAGTGNPGYDQLYTRQEMLY